MKKILSILLTLVACIGSQAQTPMKFAFTGDIMMGTNYPETPQGAYLPANDGAQLFKDVKAVLSQADIAAGNLEGTLLDNGGTVKRCSDPSICYAFRTPTAYVNNLTDAGMDFMGIANNHINDFGAAGIASTEKTLGGAGIKYAGLRGRCETAIIEKRGKKVGFAAFGHNRGTLSIHDMEEVKRVVGDLDRKCDIVVVSFHGGGEGPRFTHVPHASETCFGENRGNVEKFAHTAIDAGADIVYGHGPHVTRAVELYKDRFIMYSLGNFCTPYRVNLNGISGHAPVVTVDTDASGRFISGKIHSFIQQKGIGPRIDKNNAVSKNMRALTLSDFPSTPITIADDGSITRKTKK